MIKGSGWIGISGMRRKDERPRGMSVRARGGWMIGLFRGLVRSGVGGIDETVWVVGRLRASGECVRLWCELGLLERVNG